jgi:hypothetical protein
MGVVYLIQNCKRNETASKDCKTNLIETDVTRKNLRPSQKKLHESKPATH